MGRMNLLTKFVNDSKTQVEGFCIVRSVAQKSNIKGNDYLDFVLADASGEIIAKLWDYAPEQHGIYTEDTVIKVRATINPWRDGEQLKIDKIRNLKAGEDVDMRELICCAPKSGEEMYQKLFSTAEGFKNPDLAAVTKYILKESRERLLKHPAALKLHHAMRGGLLYHTCTMLDAAKALITVYKPLYPSLDEELVCAGIILHDISKIDELTVGSLGLATGYSLRGQLLGHINMGVAMIERAAAELLLEGETVTMLQHILLSHHGIPDYGSPRYPMFPEAEIVSTVDLLDSRLFEMYDALSSTQAGGFSERQWALDNRQLYKRADEE